MICCFCFFNDASIFSTFSQKWLKKIIQLCPVIVQRIVHKRMIQVNFFIKIPDFLKIANVQLSSRFPTITVLKIEIFPG